MRPALRTAALLALVGCDFAPSGEDWGAQLAPSGPCYEAGLADGLDDTDEVHAVFACVNATGALDAYAPLDAALDAPTRDGPAGAVLLAWVDVLPTADLSLPGLLDGAQALLEDPSDLMLVLRLGFELVYASAWSTLGDDVPLNSTSSLELGALVPLLPTAGAIAGVVLDDRLAPLDPVVEALRSDTLRDAAWTLASVGTSTHPDLEVLADAWPDDLADAVARTRDPANDRWSEATGDSLRDLAGQVFTRTGNDGRPTIEHLGDPLRPVLADAIVRDRLEAAIADEWDAGRLQNAVPELVHLASVDVRGGELADGEDSALVALVRLLHDANVDVDCTIDLGLFDIDIALGNLSVALLQRMADWDRDTVAGGVDLLGAVLGVDLTDDVLELVADSGVCPEIDAQLVSDLHALDRFNDPEVGDLLYVMLAVLEALDAQESRVPELVDLVSTVHAFGLVEPGEEVLRDLADAPLVAHLVGFVPVLLDPWAFHDPDVFPLYVEPLDFDAAWGVVEAALEEDGDGVTDLGRLSGVLNAFMAQEGSWTALGNLAALLAQPEAEVRGALPLLADALAADEQMTWADDAADLLEDEALSRPVLVLVECDALREAVATTELTQPGPLPFTATLVRSGSLELWLEAVRLLSTLLPEDAP